MYNRRMMPINYRNMGNNRIIGGGFALPFVLGGLTGSLLTPSFYPRPYPVPVYPYPIQPYPIPGPGPIYY